MANVVVERVAGEVARVAALEQALQVVERAADRGEFRARIARAENGEHGVAHLGGALDVDAVRDVVPVEPVLHSNVRRAGLPSPCLPLPSLRRIIPPVRWRGKEMLRANCSGRNEEKRWEPAGKPGSVAP